MISPERHEDLRISRMSVSGIIRSFLLARTRTPESGWTSIHIPVVCACISRLLSRFAHPLLSFLTTPNAKLLR